VGVGVPPTATVTDSAWTLVMLKEAGVTVTVGVLTELVAVPLSKIVWVELGTLRLLSVSVREPLIVPDAVGAKLIDSVQDTPAARVPADGAELPVTGHGVAPELLKEKFVEILGLFPLGGMENLSAVPPLFNRVTNCGLSLLVDPTAVEEKLRLGASARSSFTIRLF
jgi:hypothetical protein